MVRATNRTHNTGWWVRSKCPKCSKLLVTPHGNHKASILLVGEFPGYEEIREGVPFCGRTGDVLKSEMMRLGLQFNACRVTNLWQHAPDETTCDLRWHLDQLVKEFKGKSHVLLMGSDVVSALLGKAVSNYAGLKVRIPEFKNIHFWVSPNPAVVFHGPLGELRLSLERFAQDVQHNY